MILVGLLGAFLYLESAWGVASEGIPQGLILRCKVAKNGFAFDNDNGTGYFARSSALSSSEILVLGSLALLSPAITFKLAKDIPQN